MKQIRSEIGHAETMRRTLRALGLRHHQQTVQLPNTASIRGMLYKVRHLVEVTPARGEAMADKTEGPRALPLSTPVARAPRLDPVAEAASGAARAPGLGKTSGKGHKGHKARTGGGTNPGFEGGQMPMYRRLPKRGFTNPFRVETQVGQPVGAQEGERGRGRVRRRCIPRASSGSRDAPVKLLGTGDADRAYTVRGVALSASARAKIEAAGGKIEG